MSCSDWRVNEIMISSGLNILRFVKVATARTSQIDLNAMWLYKFTADSLSGEHLDFIFKVSQFGQLPNIVRDLIVLTKEKKWWLVDLKENSQRMLMIQSIKEPNSTQEELNLKSKAERLKVQ